MRIAVVGAGVTGLTTSALLARQGHDVVLVEATPQLGGLAASIALGPHRFCPGPQYLWGFGDDGDATRILARTGARLAMRRIPDGFERIILGDHDVSGADALVDGVPLAGLSAAGARFAGVLDQLGRCGDVIARGASFRTSGPGMMARVAASSLSLSDKGALFVHRHDSVLEAARHYRVPDDDLRRLTTSQPIFAESLADLSVVLFAACRQVSRRVDVPVGGMTALPEALEAAVVDAGVDIRRSTRVTEVRNHRGGVALSLSAFPVDDGAHTRVGHVEPTQHVEHVQHVVWCCSPAVVQALVPGPHATFEPAHPVCCLALDVDLDDDAITALWQRSLSWFKDFDDVAFAPSVPADVDGPSTNSISWAEPKRFNYQNYSAAKRLNSLRALNILAPTLNGCERPSPGRHVVCAYAPSGSSSDEILQRVQTLLAPKHLHGWLRLDGDDWERFGPGGRAVYGRRKTSASMQRSLQTGLPPTMSVAHAGVGIPGVLGCMQMAEATADAIAHRFAVKPAVVASPAHPRLISTAFDAPGTAP